MAEDAGAKSPRAAITAALSQGSQVQVVADGMDRNTNADTGATVGLAGRLIENGATNPAGSPELDSYQEHGRRGVYGGVGNA